jgi:hypothetical protein
MKPAADEDALRQALRAAADRLTRASRCTPAGS